MEMWSNTSLLDDADALLHCLQIFADKHDTRLLHELVSWTLGPIPDLTIFGAMMRTQSLAVVKWMFDNGWSTKFELEPMQWIVRHERMDLLDEFGHRMALNKEFRLWCIALEESFPAAARFITEKMQFVERLSLWGTIEALEYAAKFRVPVINDALCKKLRHAINNWDRISQAAIANFAMVLGFVEFQEVAVVIARHSSTFLSSSNRLSALKRFVNKNWLQATEALLDISLFASDRARECSAVIGFATSAECVQLLFRYGAKLEPFPDENALNVMCSRVICNVASEDALCAVVEEAQSTRMDALNPWRRNMRLLLWKSKSPAIASVLKEVVAPMVGTLPDNVARCFAQYQEPCSRALRNAVNECKRRQRQKIRNRLATRQNPLPVKRKLST